MKRRVVWSDCAATELKSQVRYILQYNKDAAEKILRLIANAGNQLGERPIGRPGSKTGVYERVMPGSPYVLVYSLEIPGVVTILHVFHCAQDWQSIMNGRRQ